MPTACFPPAEDSAEVRSAEVRSDKFYQGEIRPPEVRPGEVRHEEFRSVGVFYGVVPVVVKIGPARGRAGLAPPSCGP